MPLSTLIAAHQNIAEAQYYIGVMLRDGLGQPSNEQEALIWLERASAGGYKPTPDTNENPAVR